MQSGSPGPPYAGSTMTDVAELDAATPDVAAELLRASCASRGWLDAMVRTRPHRTLAALVEASDSALAELSWDDIGEALAAHPRIGQRAAGADREAAWSRQEQSSATTTDDSVAADLFAANVEYDARFGHVFLICATGRSAREILAEARRRLGNDIETERTEVRRELRDIVRLRLAKTFDGY
jgi:2-oxo-4-hydroxy-4-carboxy-5-ureidoimidazoline decarboxylase